MKDTSILFCPVRLNPQRGLLSFIIGGEGKKKIVKKRDGKRGDGYDDSLNYVLIGVFRFKISVKDEDKTHYMRQVNPFSKERKR